MRLRSVIAVAVAFGVPLAVYAASLHRGVDYWDTGELQTVPYILGIAHPSGFPAYVMGGWIWSHIVPLGDPAYRMNLLSAVGMATAAAAAAASVIELGGEPVVAAGAALVFALTRVPWDHATRADVHAVALATIGLGVWLALRWRRTGSRGALTGCAIFSALALGVHSGMILVVPGIVLVALSRRPSLRQTAVCFGLGAVIVSAAYAYLPIRSAVLFAQRRDPTLALGIPPGRPFWDSDHPSTWSGFRAEVGGGAFGTAKALKRLADPDVIRQLPASYGETAVGDLAGGIMLIALAGIVVVVRRSPLAGVGIVAGTLLPVLFVLAYPAESDPERYYLPSYWAIALFLGVGADVLSRGGLAHAPRPLIAVVAAMFLFVAGGDAFANRGAFAAAADNDAKKFVDRVLRETPPGAILVAPWMYATPLAYAAYVEKRLGKRILVTGWPDEFERYYPEWIAHHSITFITDDPILAVAGVQIEQAAALTPAPHFFAARPIVR